MTGGWVCVSCTLRNEANKRRCLACGARRPIQETETFDVHSGTTATRKRQRTETGSRPLKKGVNDFDVSVLHSGDIGQERRKAKMSFGEASIPVDKISAESAKMLDTLDSSSIEVYINQPASPQIQDETEVVSFTSRTRHVDATRRSFGAVETELDEYLTQDKALFPYSQQPTTAQFISLQTTNSEVAIADDVPSMASDPPDKVVGEAGFMKNVKFEPCVQVDAAANAEQKDSVCVGDAGVLEDVSNIRDFDFNVEKTQETKVSEAANASFINAGSKKEILVSAKSLQIAAEIFETERKDENLQYCGVDELQCNDANNTTARFRDEPKHDETASFSGTASFMNAGSKQQILVEAVDLASAAKLLEANRKGSREKNTDGMRGLLQRVDRGVDGGNGLSSTHGREDVTEHRAVSFMTAGSKRQVVVSPDSLSKAKELLEDRCSSEERMTSRNVAAHQSESLRRFGDLNTSVLRGKESNLAMRSIESFVIAGSQQKILVTPESLATAARVLEGSCTSDQDRAHDRNKGQDTDFFEKDPSKVLATLRGESTRTDRSRHGLPVRDKAILGSSKEQTMASATSPSEFFMSGERAVPQPTTRERISANHNVAIQTPSIIPLAKRTANSETSHANGIKSIALSREKHDMICHPSNASSYQTMTPKRLLPRLESRTPSITIPSRRPSADYVSLGKEQGNGLVLEFARRYSLREFEDLFGGLNSSFDSCVAEGLSETILRIDSINATALRFDKLSRKPKGFDFEEDGCSQGLSVGLEELTAALELNNPKITRKWVKNHTRWVVWKLASMERRFPSTHGGKTLTYANLIRQLQARQTQELKKNRRSALRKVLNGDVSPGTAMILCVCFVSPLSAVKPRHNDRVMRGDRRVELTDGWYSVQGSLDRQLSQAVEQGKIRTGTKLLVSNASLHGAEGGIDPLDENYVCCGTQGAALLELSANSTRLAAWHETMGFLNPARLAPHRGMVPVRCLSDVILDGGKLPSIDLVVCRVYPLLFLEKTDSDLSPRSNLSHSVVSEAENSHRVRLFNEARELVVDEITEGGLQEFVTDIDDNAPGVWRRMIASIEPNEFYACLASTEKKTIDEWEAYRRQKMIQQLRTKVDEKLGQTDERRRCLPFWSVRVKSYGIKTCDQGALLTLWNPDKFNLSLLKEGNVVRIQNLSVKATKFDNLVQLATNDSTTMRATPNVRQSKLRLSYIPRRVSTIFDLHVLSRNCFSGQSSTSSLPEVDVAGVLINASSSNSRQSIYVTDQSGLVARVDREVARPGSQNSKELANNVWVCQPCGQALKIRDAKVASFDPLEGVAVVIFAQTSSVECMGKLCSCGPAVVQVVSRPATFVPSWPLAPRWGINIAIGFVMEHKLTLSSRHFEVKVDCGGHIHCWKCPFALFNEISTVVKATVAIVSNNPPKGKTDLSVRPVTHGGLMRFVLQRNEETYEVRQVGRVESRAVLNLWQT